MGVNNSILGNRRVTKLNLWWIILEISDYLKDNSNPWLSPGRIIRGPSRGPVFDVSISQSKSITDVQALLYSTALI